ncbi:MAG: nitrogen fixation protein [Cyanobium sp.]
MVWSELERLVEDAESDAMLRRSLRRCRSRRELVMACRRLGYRIQSTDSQMAWSLDRTERQARDLAASR